jgi:hypothetical protein
VYQIWCYHPTALGGVVLAVTEDTLSDDAPPAPFPSELAALAFLAEPPEGHALRKHFRAHRFLIIEDSLADPFDLAPAPPPKPAPAPRKPKRKVKP